MKKRYTKVMAMIIAGAVLLSGCGGGKTPSKEKKQEGGEKVVTVAQTGDWDKFMVMDTTNAGADNVNELMFDRLMVLNTDGTFGPRLAESWETNEAQDKIIYHLNKNAKWHDGEPVTAEDVVYSAQVASSSEYFYQRRIRMQYFAGTDETGCELSKDSIEVKALDDHTVEFTLKTPMDPSIIYALVNRDFFIIPHHLLSEISDEALANDPFWQKPIGSGPCIDVLSGNTQLPLAEWEAAKNAEGVVAKSVPTYGYQYMAMNTSREYLTEDVRHAISYAINRQVIVDQLLQGEGRIAIGPLADDHPYRNKNIQPEYNVEKAKEIMKKVNWDPNRKLQVLVSTGNEVREKSAILIQQDLEKIGIQTELQTLEFPTLLNNARNGDYDLCFIGSAGSVDPSESVPNVTVGYMNNFAQLSDPAIGLKGEEGAKEITFEARKKVYDEYQQLLYDQMPMAFLYHTNDLFAYSDKIENVREGVLDYNINKNGWEWKVTK